MSIFDLDTSIRHAQERFGSGRSSTRRGRSDRGAFRLAPEVARALSRLLAGYDRPSPTRVLERLGSECRARGFRAPSRATVYNFIDHGSLPLFRIANLPRHVRDTLFNLSPQTDVPGDQLAFHCLNYGGPSAMSFAAGLPWWPLHRASSRRGWRPKSRGVLDAILRVRNA